MELTKELIEVQRGFVENVPKDIVKIVNDGIDHMVVNKYGKDALKVGMKAPDFSLKNATGKNIQLADLLKDGPVVLSWYRGGWCPYCSVELKFLQKILPEIKEAGATLVALSPELPDNSLSTKEKNALDFEVLSDFNNDVARQFGVVYTIHGEEFIDLYNSMHHLDEHNGISTNELPIPATYVIDQDSTILYAFVDPDYTHRAESAEILNALKK